MRQLERFANTTEFVPNLLDILRVVDGVVMIACGYFTYQLRYAWEPLGDVPSMLLFSGVLLFLIVANHCQLYNPQRLVRFKRQMVPLTATHLLSLIILTALMFFLHIAGDYSRLWITTWFVVGFGAMALIRLWLIYWLQQQLRHGALARRILLLGNTENTQKVLHALRHERATLHFVGVCILDAEPVAPTHLPEPFFDSGHGVRIPLIHAVFSIADYCRTHPVDELIITSDLEAHPEAAAILTSLESLPCSVRYCMPGHFFGRPLADAGLLGQTSAVTIPVVTIYRKPLNNRQILLKRLSDLCLASAALLVFSPVMAYVAWRIKQEKDGPILFRQERLGFAGNRFTIFKFRSMRLDASDQQATRNDARVTRIGAWIRRTSLDELPQLFNVLRGDMSFIGPRPHAMNHHHYYEKMIASYAARHRIKPGITGFAQVNGWRGETETLDKMQRRVEHDLYYIEHWSLWLDFKIAVLTLFSAFRDKNAY